MDYPTVQIVNAITGVVELAIVVALVVEARKVGRGVPPIVWGLVAFFIIDALVAGNRSELFWERSDTFIIATALDVIALSILLVVFLNARHLARAAISTIDLAAYRAEEYERARLDYHQIVRHRMMNPLTVIEGAAQTLKSGASDSPEIRDQLCEVITNMTRELHEMTLEPERRDVLERGLQAVPRDDPPTQ
jgi:signal transduction histidine kinase